jgi:spore germination protein GerM
MSARRPSVVIVGMVLVIALAACGVQTQDQPVTVDRDAVPFALLDATTTTRPGVPGSSVTIYLVGKGGLVPVTRTAGDGRGPAAAFAALIDGPTSAEAAAGLVSQVVEENAVLVGVHNGLATVRLGSVLDASNAVALDPIAQIVLTLTAFPGVDRVAFVIDGERVEIPRADGSLSSAPVTRAEYAPLVAGG